MTNIGKFVVIDKEKVERSEHSELIKTAISLLIKHCVATELSTDDSIEERAKRYGYSINGDDGIKEFLAYKDAATEQDIISKAREGEFSKWCSVNGWYFYSKDNIWRKHGSGGFEYKTTEELFNQFANR